jgi:type II secretory pathway component GspD/PulD (secretin)
VGTEIIDGVEVVTEDAGTSTEVTDDTSGFEGVGVTLESAPEGEAAASPTYEVVIDGETVSVSLDEALAGYSRQADYTRKTQELATQREELGYASRLVEALESDPQSAIDALMQAYEISQGTQIAPVAPTGTSEPLDPEEQRIADLESRLVAQEQAAFERQVNAEIARLHTQYGNFDDVSLVRFAVENGINSLTVAAKAFMFDAISTKATADQAAAAAKRALPPVAGGHGVAGGAVTAGAANDRPTIREAIEAAFAAHQ